MSSWLESHTTLREHPKRKRLSRLLGQNLYETIGLLHVMWWWVLDFAPEGDLSAFSDDDIADAVDWPDDAGALMGALTRAGFVDADRHVHDWDEYAEKWIARRVANRERMRAARAKRNGPEQHGFAHVRNTSGARAAGRADAGSEDVRNTSGARALQKAKSVGLPDLPDQPTYQPDRTNLPTSPPLPPSPQAGRGEGRTTKGGVRRRMSATGFGDDASPQAVPTPRAKLCPAGCTTTTHGGSGGLVELAEHWTAGMGVTPGEVWERFAQRHGRWPHADEAPEALLARRLEDAHGPG